LRTGRPKCLRNRRNFNAIRGYLDCVSCSSSPAIMPINQHLVTELGCAMSQGSRFKGARRRSGAGGRRKWAVARWAVTKALVEKSASWRAATRADQAPSVLEFDARRSNPDSAPATPPASCGAAAAGNPGGRKCAAGCPLGCRKKPMTTDAARALPARDISIIPAPAARLRVYLDSKRVDVLLSRHGRFWKAPK